MSAATMKARGIVERRIPLRLCTTIAPSGTTVRPFVRCPRTEQSVDARQCAGCMRMRSLEWNPDDGGEVRCLIGADDSAVDPRSDFAEVAARTRLHEVGRRVATCVTPDVPLEQVRELLHERRALAVVDDEGKLQGIVSRSDLTRAGAVAGDVMTTKVHALPEDVPVSFAVSLLALERLGEVPVVRMNGTVTGMCDSNDLLRWVAGRLGYTAPKK